MTQIGPFQSVLPETVSNGHHVVLFLPLDRMVQLIFKSNKNVIYESNNYNQQVGWFRLRCWYKIMRELETISEVKVKF